MTLGGAGRRRRRSCLGHQNAAVEHERGRVDPEAFLCVLAKDLLSNFGPLVTSGWRFAGSREAGEPRCRQKKQTTISYVAQRKEGNQDGRDV